jgi:hypothetical protein
MSNGQRLVLASIANARHARGPVRQKAAAARAQRLKSADRPIAITLVANDTLAKIDPAADVGMTRAATHGLRAAPPDWQEF